MFRVLQTVIVLLMSSASPSPLWAAPEKRVALVIGNAAYAHAPRHDNPANDASDMAAALKRLGFDVIEGLDLDESGMRRTVKRFAELLTGGDVGLFFYAGHGLQVSGHNYLVPVDARLETAAGFDFKLIPLMSSIAPWSARPRPTSFSSMPAVTTRCRATSPAQWERAPRRSVRVWPVVESVSGR